MKVNIGLCPTSLSRVTSGLGLWWCPTLCKTGFMWISPLRTRQAVSCITPICSLPDVNKDKRGKKKSQGGVWCWDKRGLCCGGLQPLTIFFFNGGCRVADPLSIRWARLRHWGLLSCDPCGLSVVHVLAAHRTVILKGGGVKERQRESGKEKWTGGKRAWSGPSQFWQLWLQFLLLRDRLIPTEFITNRYVLRPVLVLPSVSIRS